MQWEEGSVVAPITFPYEIDANETLQIALVGQTQQDVRWRAQLHWASGEERGIVTLDDEGEPFRVVGGDLPRLFFDGSVWAPSEG